MHIKKEQAQAFEIPGGTTGRLYPPTPAGDQSVAFVRANGVYPETGWSVNSVCTETLYVINGSIRIEHGTESAELAAGDLFAILPGTRYRIIGTAEVMDFITPVWDKHQNQIVP